MSYCSEVIAIAISINVMKERKDLFFPKQNSAMPNAKNTFFQAKFYVNQPGDQYEQEADAVANSVISQPAEKSPLQQCEMNVRHSLSITPVQTKPETGSGAASPVISSKIESSAGKGTPLPQKTLQEMNASFGADFSSVKVHHDSEAVNMNGELQAQAFTHGRDIYFNKGKYNPENKEGKFLLAHELTHVVQQQSAVQAKPIQRSFWGTVGGALVGAVGGFLVGGPVGAVVGGVAGGVGGDAATTHKRGLNNAELQEAQKVFGNSLNYGAVSVSDSSELMQIGGYARTPGNTVFFPTGTLGRTDSSYFAFLIHELTHTWQSQHGVSVLTKIRYSLSESNYDFGGDAGLAQAIKDGKCFNDFNTEAQASILEKYYKILNGIAVGDLSVYEHFVWQVQNLKGRCGMEGSGIKTDILDPKFRSGNDKEKSFA